MSENQLSRRGMFATVPALLFAAGCAQAAAARDLVVYKTPWCGCCKGWVTHMTRAGFRPVVKEVQDLAPVRLRHGISFHLSSCHTSEIGGYVLEGHVPPADVVKLLNTRPRGLGLVVPGMPIGSPGMEQASGATERFDTLLLLDKTGRTSVFARHT